LSLLKNKLITNIEKELFYHIYIIQIVLLRYVYC